MKRSDGITVDGCGMFCGTVFDGSAMEQSDAAMGWEPCCQKYHLMRTPF